MALHLRGVVLPGGEERDLYVAGGLITLEPVAGAATVVDRGWLVPGLVDVHTHPGAERPGDPLGVTVLAGTDSLGGEHSPHGRVADEIRWLARAGVPAEAALGAGSWTARRWLGLPGIEEGAPADLVAFPADPRRDLAVLDEPSRVVLRSRVVR